jgi:hypothetical protein
VSAWEGRRIAPRCPRDEILSAPRFRLIRPREEGPVAKQETIRYRQLARGVDRAENIPTDRAPTAEDLQQVDDLVAALRLTTSDGEKYAKLLRRAKAVQRRLKTPTESDRPSRKASVPSNAVCAKSSLLASSAVPDWTWRSARCLAGSRRRGGGTESGTDDRRQPVP